MSAEFKWRFAFIGTYKQIHSCYLVISISFSIRQGTFGRKRESYSGGYLGWKFHAEKEKHDEIQLWNVPKVKLIMYLIEKRKTRTRSQFCTNIWWFSKKLWNGNMNMWNMKMFLNVLWVNRYTNKFNVKHVHLGIWGMKYLPIMWPSWYIILSLKWRNLIFKLYYKLLYYCYHGQTVVSVLYSLNRQKLLENFLCSFVYFPPQTKITPGLSPLWILGRH